MKIKKQKKTKLISLIKILSIIFSILSILSYLSSYINPNDIGFMPFLGLIYFPLIILNLFLILILIIKKEKFVILPIIFLLFSGLNVLNNFQINLKTNSVDRNNTFRILSYNVRIFNKYKWIDEENIDNQIINLLEEKTPDVICLQEFYSSQKDNYYKEIINKTKCNYNFVAYGNNNLLNANHGLVIFTKYPIIYKDYIYNETGKTLGIFTDVKINNDTIRIYNLHLASFHLGKKDYELVDSIANIKDIELNKFTTLFKKMITAYQTRSYQTNLITEYLKKSPYRVIICGDFNDNPNSYTYRYLKNNLKDSFYKYTFGTSITFNNMKMPFRIDYILHDKRIKVRDYNKIDVNLSDHFPIYADFKF